MCFIFMWKILTVPCKLAREKPKVVKGSNAANDGPEAKKPKVDPNETTMVKKVGMLVDLVSVNYIIFIFSQIYMTL